MPLSTAEQEQINSCKRQCRIDFNSAYSWVSIVDLEDPDNALFIDGHDADSLIDKAKVMFEEKGDISFEDALHFYCYDYLDLVFQS